MLKEFVAPILSLSCKLRYGDALFGSEERHVSRDRNIPNPSECRFFQDSIIATKGNYSYRKASIGSRFAAFLAGQTPKIRPTLIETIMPLATAHSGIEAGS
jgi:hypothetical protein